MKKKIILIVLIATAVAMLSTAPLSAKGEADRRGEWAGSSLTFVSGCEGDCQQIKAILCNTGDGPMQDSVEWELFYSPQGNPKWGEVIERGIILPLEAGECVELSYQPSQSGNYMWRVEQEEGHPGKGEVWSEACSVICEQMTPTVPLTFTPLPTSTPTPTQIFPTPSPTPSPTPPAISSPTPTPTVEGEKEAEEVFSVKIEEVPPPPTGGRGLEDISYPLFCQGGSLLFILATMGLAIRLRS